MVRNNGLFCWKNNGMEDGTVKYVNVQCNVQSWERGLRINYYSVKSINSFSVVLCITGFLLSRCCEMSQLLLEFFVIR